MRIGLGKLGQLFEVIGVPCGNPETGHLCAGVRLNVGDALNSLQIASDRDGTSPSDHIGNFEAHKSEGLGDVVRTTLRAVLRSSGFRGGLLSASHQNAGNGNQGKQESRHVVELPTSEPRRKQNQMRHPQDVVIVH